MSSLTHGTRRRRRRDVRRLRRIPTFRDADSRRLAELLPHTDHLRLPSGRTLVRSGEPARELITIVAGEAAARSPHGDVAVLRSGAEIGARELLDRQRHAVTVVALSDLEVVVVNAPAVRWAHQEGLATHPAPPAPGSQQPSSPEPPLVVGPATATAISRQTVTS